MAVEFDAGVTTIRDMIANSSNKIGLEYLEEFINKIFKQYSFTNQERGVVLAELCKVEMSQKTTLFIEGAIKAATLEKDLEIKDKQILLLDEQIETEDLKQKTELKRMANLSAQAALVFRQEKNYDDALQKKVTETSGSYANFAVMADPAGAQGPLDNFKIELQNLKNRITGTGLIPVPVESINGSGHLLETFTVGALVATIEHRDAPDDDYVVSDGVTPVTVATYELALAQLIIYLEL